jgi:DNA invertase Pin-like site-specific DNA recombinase
MSATRPLRAALYARVSTNDQTTDNQLLELRRYAEARGWTATEYVDQGVSGAKESRPAIDALLKDARRRRFDVVVCWSLDRIGRSLKHVVVLLDDLQALGVSFVSVREGLDWTTPSGRLQAQLLSMIAEFERARIRERVCAGVARAKAQGRRLGRPEKDVPEAVLAPVRGLSVREAAKRLGVSTATAHRWLQKASRKSSPESTLQIA